MKRYIIFEGIDGSGKTTIAKALTRSEYSSLFLYFYSIILKKTKDYKIWIKAIEKLPEDKIILCDRSPISHFVYKNKKPSKRFIRWLKKNCIIIFLDCPVKEAYKRKSTDYKNISEAYDIRKKYIQFFIKNKLDVNIAIPVGKILDIRKNIFLNIYKQINNEE